MSGHGLAPVWTTIELELPTAKLCCKREESNL